MAKKERLFFLDAARGLGMVLVILGHIWETDGTLPVLIYSFHIPLFFIISGVLLAYMQAAKRSLKQIIFQGIRRLLIPYLFFEILFIVFYGIRNRFDFGGQTILGGLLMNPLNVPLWFLPTLFFAELIVLFLLKAEQTETGRACFSRFCRSIRADQADMNSSSLPSDFQADQADINSSSLSPDKKSGRLMLTAAVLLYLIPFFVSSGGSPVLSAVFRCCTSIGFTAFGYAGCEFILKTDLHPVFPALLLIPDFLLALLNGKTGIYKLTFGNPILFTLCGITGSLLVLLALRHVRIRILEWIGENTLVFLGLHIIMLRIVQLIPGLNTDTILGGLAAMVLVCVLLTPVSLFLNRFFPLLTGKK